MEKRMNRPAWVEIDLKAFDSNVKLIKERIAPGAQMMAVVKADCYGHCMRECYKVLKENDVCNFGIATISEAEELRSYCASEDRIVMFSLPSIPFIETICDLNIVTLIQNLEYAKALSDEAVKCGITMEVMGVVDTGMGRYGFLPEDGVSSKSSSVYSTKFSSS